MSAVSALAADLTSTMVTMASGLNGNEPIALESYHHFALFAGFILLNGIMNSMGLAWLTLLTQVRTAVCSGTCVSRRLQTLCS